MSIGNLGGFAGPYMNGFVRDLSGGFTAPLMAIGCTLLLGATLFAATSLWPLVAIGVAHADAARETRRVLFAPEATNGCAIPRLAAATGAARRACPLAPKIFGAVDAAAARHGPRKRAGGRRVSIGSGSRALPTPGHAAKGEFRA